MSVKPSNAVLIRGQSGQLCLVNSSGQLAVNASVTVGDVDVSGGVVALWQGSGRNGVFITNQSGTLFTDVDLSGRLAVTNSGAVITSRVSGQYVTTSGNVTATWNESGRNIVTLGNQLGTAVATVATVGDNATVSNALNVNAKPMGYDFGTNSYSPLRVTSSGSPASNSGTSYRLLVDTTQAGLDLKTSAFVPCTSASGGEPLSASGVVIYGISIKNVSGTVNSAIHIGSSGNPPFISGGYVLDIGDERELRIANPVFVRVYARTSGAIVSWMGVNF